MSRADAYRAFYRDSRARLLHQVYAYCGDTEVAQRALTDAFVSAGHHWRKLSGDPGKDAWMRARAFRATRRGLNRARRPWYVRAGRTADGHRPLLVALHSLSPTDRHLVVLVHLAGLDLLTAAREVGTTDGAAEQALSSAELVLAEHGVDGTDGIRAALFDLRDDLSEGRMDSAARLRREGNRRRRARLGLAGLCSVALVIGAGALTAAQPEHLGSPGTSDTAAGTQDDADVATRLDKIDASVLTATDDVRKLTSVHGWRLDGTSRDLRTSTPYDECLRAVPNDPRAAHFYVRTFRSGSGPRPTVATQAVEVSASVEAADSSYARLVKRFSACTADNHQITRYSTVRGVGDVSSVISLKYVDKRGVHDQLISISESGLATIVWVIDAPNDQPPAARRVVTLAASSVRAVCRLSMGTCPRRPYLIVGQVPPKVDRADGFLTAIDLPVFAGLTEPWVATSPNAVSSNPAATGCDRADFAGSKATTLSARSFVVPSARTLATIFGMTETRGVFPSVARAENFLDDVSRNVTTCHDRMLSLQVLSTRSIDVEQGTARIWTIKQTMSRSRDLTFRVALVRVGTTVAQVTFTPMPGFDLSPEQFASLARRAALRALQV
ncbi:MAG TPA: hypothetical protein VH419_04500 [Nocardioidaceae bacterium]